MPHLYKRSLILRLLVSLSRTELLKPTFIPELATALRRKIYLEFLETKIIHLYDSASPYD